MNASPNVDFRRRYRLTLTLKQLVTVVRALEEFENGGPTMPVLKSILSQTKKSNARRIKRNKK